MKIDGESVLEFVISDLGIKGKIGVYGRSMGGVVATHLAATFPKIICFLLADRTFGNLKTVSKRQFIGKASKVLFRMMTLDWETNNDINYYNVTSISLPLLDEML